MREDTFALFMQRFNVEAATSSARRPAAAEELHAVELALHTRLPNSFREFMQKYGGAWTPHILPLVTQKADEESFALQQLIDVSEMIELTRSSVAAGMPGELVAFGFDAMGNLFCFRRADASSDEAPVLLYDHDYDVIREIAGTFEEFLASYLELPPMASPEEPTTLLDREFQKPPYALKRDAAEAWQRKDYDTVVDSLLPIEHSLTEVERRKLAYARKQLAR